MQNYGSANYGSFNNELAFSPKKKLAWFDSSRLTSCKSSLILFVRKAQAGWFGLVWFTSRALLTTPSVTNYNSSNFFISKFNYSSYSKQFVQT